MKAQRCLLISLLTFLSLTSNAEDVVVDGVTYNLIPKGKVAEVVESRDSILQEAPVLDEAGDITFDGEGNIVMGYVKTHKPYSGDIVIPEKIIYDETEYDVKIIKDGAFSGRTLNSISIPSSITKIGTNAFFRSPVTTVIISDLAAWCGIDFGNCHSCPLQFATHFYLNEEEITEAVIPNGVTSIGKEAFYCYKGFTSIKIPSSVKSIGYEAFYGCDNVTTIVVGDNESQEANTVIGQRAFYECTNVDSVFLGSNIEKIDKEAFYDCKKLERIIIPNSVNSIGTHVFLGCENLESVKLSDNITSIEWSCFNGCKKLSDITIPDGVTTLGDAAFADCVSLTSINLPSALQDIGWHVFQGCTGLTSIDIPDMVTFIQIGAFDRCSNLKTVSLGKSLTDIRPGVFKDCPNIEDVYCYAKNPPACYREYLGYYGRIIETFQDSYIEYATLHVPASAIDAYKSTEPWSTFGTIEAMPEPDFVLGDVNNDGAVDISDYIGVANHILGNTPAGFNATAADVNNDGDIDISDYIGVANIILTGKP